MNGSGKDAVTTFPRQATSEEIAIAVRAILDGDYDKADATLFGTLQASCTLQELQRWLVAYGAHGFDTPDLEVTNDYARSETGGSVPIIQPMEELKPSVSLLRMGAGTPLACTNCHRINMSVYYLKRANGKYDVLCSDCYAHSPRGLCTYIDRDEAQCTDLAEFMVVYGQANDLMRRAVCSRHIPAVLGDAPEYKLYPLDNELAGLR